MVLDDAFPWCSDWEDELRELFRGYVEAKQQRSRARLRRPAAVLVPPRAGPVAGRDDRGAFRPRAGRRVPGHQRAAGDDPAGAMRPRARGSRWWATTPSRSTPSAPPRCATSSTFPRTSTPAAASRHAGAELPLHATDPRRHQRGDRLRRGALHQGPVLRPARRAEARLVTVEDESDQTEYVVERMLRAAARQGIAAPATRRCSFAPSITATCWRSSWRGETFLSQVRRAEVPRGGARQGPAVRAALGREPARRRRRVPHPAAASPASGPASAPQDLDARRRIRVT